MKSSEMLLAADLAGMGIDPNEAQKALAYLRSKRDPKLFFEYLRAINKNGGAVIRSGQTLGYYRDLLAVCERHLRGMSYEETAQTLGWGIRLLRYYRNVPDAAELIQQSQGDSPPTSSPKPEVRKPAPAVAQLPVVGDVFTSKITAVDETVVLIEVPGFAEDQAIGALKAERIPNGRTDRYRVGNSARVEVTSIKTLKAGRTLVELKPAAKQSSH